MARTQRPIDTNRIKYGRTLIAIVSLLVACGRMTIASDDAIPTRVPAACDAETPRLPDTIQLDADLRVDVEQMLRTSATFRRQCRRIADTPLLYVRVRRDSWLAQHGFRAKSVIERARSGVVIVVVGIGPHGSSFEWIAHEFEHVLEQVDGVRLREIAGRRAGVWRSSADTFETERAIRAGRTVVEEMRPVKMVRPHKLVERPGVSRHVCRIISNASAGRASELLTIQGILPVAPWNRLCKTSDMSRIPSAAR